MELRFAPRGIVEMDDVRIIFRNFRGEGSTFNREGDRNFAVVIPDELADELKNDVNRDGVGWNVKIRQPNSPEYDPYYYLPVKVKFSDYGPIIKLIVNGRQIDITKDTVGQLDRIDIERVDLDIRPYDDVINGRPFRAAYLQKMYITQKVDRFAERYADMEYPEE